MDYHSTLRTVSSHVMHCLWWHAWCYMPSALPSQRLRKQVAALISRHFYSSATCASHSRLAPSCLLFWRQPIELQILDYQDSNFPHKRPTPNGRRGSCCTAGAVSRPRGLDWRVETFNLELSFLKMINHTRIQRKVSDWIHNMAGLSNCIGYTGISSHHLLCHHPEWCTGTGILSSFSD